VTKVTVADGYQVVFDGTVHLAGETVEVDRDQAARWCAAGWAVPADRPASRLPSRAEVRRPVRPEAG